MLKVDHKPLFRAPIKNVSNWALKKKKIKLYIEPSGYVFDELTLNHVLYLFGGRRRRSDQSTFIFNS